MLWESVSNMDLPSENQEQALPLSLTKRETRLFPVEPPNKIFVPKETVMLPALQEFVMTVIASAPKKVVSRILLS